MDLEAVRDALRPALDACLAIPLPPATRWRPRPAETAAAAGLVGAIDALPATPATLRALEAHAAGLVRVGAVGRDPGPFYEGAHLGPHEVGGALARAIEALRLRLEPPDLDEGACDCALRRAFAVLAPAPVERLGAEGRCGRCGQRWVEEPDDLLSHARPATTPWVRARRPPAPWLDAERPAPGTCACALARWYASPRVGPRLTRAQERTPDLDVECAGCGRRWRRSAWAWAPDRAADVAAPPAPAPERAPWHLPGREALVAVADALDALLVWEGGMSPRQREDLDGRVAALGAAFAALPLDDDTLAVARRLGDTFGEATARAWAHAGPSASWHKCFFLACTSPGQVVTSQLRRLELRRASAAGAG
jgi:hypothetical protein